MLICVEGGRKETTPLPKKHSESESESETEGKTGKSMLWQSEEESVSDYAILPPPSWKHRVRAFPLHVLIMINAGSTTHTPKPRFWQGSAVVPPPPARACGSVCSS